MALDPGWPWCNLGQLGFWQLALQTRKRALTSACCVAASPLRGGYPLRGVPYKEPKTDLELINPSFQNRAYVVPILEAVFLFVCLF